MQRSERQIIRYLHALGWVVAATLVAEALFTFTGTTRVSMVFLAGVLFTAFFWGSGPGYFAAGLAFFAYNFYLSQPHFSLSFQTEDIINLVVFLAAAMLTGSLTGRVREQASAAEARARTTDILFQATREFSVLPDDGPIRERLVRRLSEVSAGAAFVRNGTRLITDPQGLAVPRAVLRQAAALEAEKGEDARTQVVGEWTLRTLRTAGLSLGIAGWRADRAARRVSWWWPDSPSRANDNDEKLLEILTDAGAAALSRARLGAAKADAESRARTEDLRNALLSSISHDLRTPLAAIMASASSLEQFGETFDEVTRRDLASTIEEEAERLDVFVSNFLNMSRLEAGALSFQKTPFSVEEVVRRSVDRRKRGARAVTLGFDPSLPEALGDPLLFEQALGNVVENALRYSPEDSELVILGRTERRKVVVQVKDKGPGVPDDELNRIFDKFYRSPGSARRSGTGLGLSIARGLMEAMGGSVEAYNRVDATTGLVVTLRLAASA